ncbi:hypothetical protein MDAP_000157 [Mitosporidium daphniae]
MALCRFSGELDKLKPIEFEDSEEHHTEVHSSSKRSGKEILGTATWTFLHRFAGMYPANPDEKYQECVRLFLNTLPHIYPCEECAVGMRAFFDCHPPETESMEKFGAWLCEIHNLVNEKLGKPQYDCANWMDQWRPEDCTSCHLSDTIAPLSEDVYLTVAKKQKLGDKVAPLIENMKHAD